MPRVVFEPATPADDAPLRRLFAANPMDGSIRVAFEREPSYFHAVTVQGRDAQVMLGRDATTGEVIGVGTRTIKKVFVNGEPCDVGYLSDLRLRPTHRGGTLVARGYRLLRELHRDGRAPLYFTAIAADNRRALETITTGRAGLPSYRDLGVFESPALNVAGFKPAIEAGVEIVRGCTELVPEIVGCLNEHGRAKQFAPVYAIEDFCAADSRLRDFRVEDFAVALRGGRVVGTLARWDQRRFKQTRIVGYGRALATLRPLFNLGAPAFGLPRFPAPGAHLDACYAGFLAIADDDVDVFRSLLRRIYQDARAAGDAYLLIGLHARDPLCAALADYRCSAFRGRLFAVHFEDGDAAYRVLDARVPHVELATL